MFLQFHFLISKHYLLDSSIMTDLSTDIVEVVGFSDLETIGSTDW